MKDFFKLRNELAITERVHYAFDTMQAARTFSNKVDSKPINMVKVGSGKYYVVELEPSANKAQQEKAAKIAVSIGLSESYAKLKPGMKENVFKLKNYKDRDRKGHEAFMNIEIVKGNTSNKFDDDFGFNKAELGAMDKVISKIKNMHISSFDGGNTAPASLEFYGDESSLKKFVADRNVQKIVKKYKGKVSGPYKS